MALYLLLPLLALSVRAQQYNPLANYCKILDHQSIVLNNTLYIHGGKEVFMPVNGTGQQYGNRTVGPNKFMFTIDLSMTWDWTSNLSINADNASLNMPQLARGALFPDPKDPAKFFLFGGATPLDNQSFTGWAPPLPKDHSLWSYDTVGDAWTPLNMSKYGLTRPASGGFAYIPEQGLAFWYNGMQDNGSAVETQKINDTTLFLGGMTILDLNNQTARNISTAAVSSKPRVRGDLVYVPVAGTDGILVLIGGGEKPNTDVKHDWKGTLVSLGSVDIFDLASLKDPNTPNGTWFSQPTSGTPPDPRLDACLVVAPAPDNSTYNIYMYGGRNGLSTYYDEVWVLSLPSFQWKKVYQSNTPRYSMSCHLVGSRQLITVGGSDTSHLTDNQSNCDWQTKMVNILDLATITWGSVYNANAGPYTVPSEIVKMVGGNAQGGATIKPAGGFSNPRLATIFNHGIPITTNSTNTTAPTPSATPPAASSSSKAGAIAGGVIGGLAGLALIAGAVFFFTRRSRAAAEPSELEAKPAPTVLLGGGEVFEKPDEGINELPGYDQVVQVADKAPAVAPVELAADGLTPSTNPGEYIDTARADSEVSTPPNEVPSPVSPQGPLASMQPLLPGRNP